MKIQRAHKIQLKPNNKQANYFVRACGVARFVYNWGLVEWNRQYEAGEKPSALRLDKQFNAIKKIEFPWVTEVSKDISQRSLKNLGKAFKNFFRNVKACREPGHPRFKKRGVKDNFYITNCRIGFEGKKVRIPKLGWVRMHESLRFDGKIMSATVSRVADKWFISVQVELEIEDQAVTGPVIGVDVGVKELAVISDGRVFPNPQALKKLEPRLRALHKAVDRKKKGSNNQKKAKLKLQRLYHRVNCVRKDSIHKLTTAITTGVSAIGIEDLNVSGMMKNHNLAKALVDASISEIHRQIQYKAEERGIQIVKADRFYPSSKTCSACGNVKKKLPLANRTYKCDVCGLEIDRDLNAAINLKNYTVGSTAKAYRLGSSGWRESVSETTDWVGNFQWFDACLT